MSRALPLSACVLGLLAAVPTNGEARKAPPTDELVVDVEVGEPVMIAGQRQRAYLQIVIEGFAPPKNQRMPVNLGLVIDRSGSMRGDRLEKAKEAALMVVDSLGPEDVLSVITYDSNVEVLLPPTRLTDKRQIRRRIMAISDRGSTALYAGVSAGIESVRRNLARNRVSRLILLSDGKANVGPSSPAQLAQLGVRAGGLGIPITTIGLGLGYNEDLMTELALSSDGNHGFAQEAADLAAMFGSELGDVMSVVASDVVIEIELEPGVRPIRGLNRPVSIRGNKAYLKLNQIYGKQKKDLLLEVEVPASRANTSRTLGKVDVRYRNLFTKKTARKKARPSVRFSPSPRAVERAAKKEVMVSVVEALANERQKKAIALRDKRKLGAAKQTLKKNSAYLRQQAKRYKSKRLHDFAEEAAGAAAEVDDDRNWRKNRKSMKKSIHTKSTKQSW